MAGNCGSCGGGGARPSFRAPASSSPVGSSADAAQAGASTLYEVVNANGTGTGRRFDSLTAATSYANRIGGSTRPV